MCRRRARRRHSARLCPPASGAKQRRPSLGRCSPGHWVGPRPKGAHEGRRPEPTGGPYKLSGRSFRPIPRAQHTPGLPDPVQDPVCHRWWPSCPWPSELAPTRPSSRCSTRCCCGRCRWPNPGELVNFGAPGPKPGSTSCNQAGDCDEVFSYPMFRDLERVQTSFTGIAAHRLFGANLAFKGQTESGEGLLVSGSYFPVLGLNPALGRLLGPDDDKTIGGHYVAVLSHDYWRTPLRRGPRRPERHAHHQRPGLDRRRRRAARLRRHHPGRAAAGVRAHHDACADAAGPPGQRLRESPLLLGLPLRPAQARRVDRPGQGGAQRPLSAPSSTTSRRRCRRA